MSLLDCNRCTDFYIFIWVSINQSIARDSMNSNKAKTVNKKHFIPFLLFLSLKYLTGSAISQAKFTAGFNKNSNIRISMNDDPGARFHPPIKSCIDPNTCKINNWGNTIPMIRRITNLYAYLLSDAYNTCEFPNICLGHITLRFTWRRCLIINWFNAEIYLNPKTL